MPLDKEAIRQSLARVRHPATGQDMLAAGAVKKVAWCDGYASITLAGGGLTDAQRAEIRQHAAAAVRLTGQQAEDPVADVHIEFTEERATAGFSATGSLSASADRIATGGSGATGGSPATASAKGSTAAPASGQHQSAASSLPGVQHIIAVGAGKGGVGKSTIAVNVAVGLARRGHAVGLLDGDIYGPSLPTMLGLSAIDPVIIETHIQPFFVHGVKAMTIGKLVDPEKPLIWRGPMAHGAFKQLTEQTRWGELDYLIIDLPPGTGDVSLTMAQILRLTGAVIVCTPQKVAQDDAVRAARMFQQLGIDVLGVVENMSYFVGDDGKEYDIFGRGGAQMMAQRLGVPFLGQVPINTALRKNSDSGEPLRNFEPKTAGGDALPRAIDDLIGNLESQVALAAMRSGARRPSMNIS